MKNDVKLTFVGDVCPADMRTSYKFGLSSKFEKTKGKEYQTVFKELFSNSNISFCNLEAPLIDLSQKEEYCFAGSKDFATFLKDVGINLVSIANNHILETGDEGFHDTLDYLNENKICYIGKYEENTSNIESFNINGMNLCFAAFSNVDLHKIDNKNNFAELNDEALHLAIEKMKSLKADIKIFSVHWGNEYINYPSQEQIRLAHSLIDMGVDIIIGHHSHVIQPVEKYKHGIIAYSLGNCLFDSVHSKNVSHGLCLKILISKKKISYALSHLNISDKYGVQIDLTDSKRYRYESIVNGFNNIIEAFNYDEKYYKMVRINRLIERINMKIKIVKRMLSIPFKEKGIMLNNIVEMYKLKFGRKL